MKPKCVRTKFDGYQEHEIIWKMDGLKLKGKSTCEDAINLIPTQIV